MYKYPFGVYLAGRGVATKGYLYVYIHTVYKYPFGVYLAGRGFMHEVCNRGTPVSTRERILGK